MSEDIRELPDGTILHTPKNDLLRIDRLWAFVSVDADGNEGLCAATAPNGMLMPLIAADESRLQGLRPIAARPAREGGQPIRLVRLSQREDLEVIAP